MNSQMTARSTLTITSVAEITDLYSRWKTLNRNFPHYGQEIVVKSPDPLELLELNNSNMVDLLQIVMKVRCPKLVMSRDRRPTSKHFLK